MPDHDEFKKAVLADASKVTLTNVFEIKAWCDENEIDSIVFTDYQIRIYDANNKIDIYPTNRRYHNINENKRGYIVGLISVFITEIFLL